MNKYRVLDAVITADPNDPTMGILHPLQERRDGSSALPHVPHAGGG